VSLEAISVAGVRAAARLARQVEVALVDVDLSLPQYRVLAFIAEGPAAASALAGKLAVSRPSVTALIDGLVGRGFVERRPDPTDRRRVDHRLTAAGERALDRADAAVDQRLRWLAGHLPADDGAAALDGLVRWGDALDAARAAKSAGR
jgi:long-chain acyl-CoA synthetase